MDKTRKKNIWTLTVQVAVWTAAMLLPAFTIYYNGHNTAEALVVARGTAGFLAPLAAIYFANFYLLVPRLFICNRRWAYAAANVLLILAVNLHIFLKHTHQGQLPAEATKFVYMGIFTYLLLCALMVFLALGIRHILHTSHLRMQLQEERQKNAEAELAWLKNQLNPHFLFNTLNNISSLVQISPDEAQDSIAQLSELLRYAMYETDKPAVPMEGEVEFMQNYIDLMRLRCDEKTNVTAVFNCPATQLAVPPLLFISLIENAFKHGVSYSRPSFISIRMDETAEGLTFRCANSNHPKTDSDRSGSGIGLENTRRRLQLLYPGEHTWQQRQDADTYEVEITISAKGLAALPSVTRQPTLIP